VRSERKLASPLFLLYASIHTLPSSLKIIVVRCEQGAINEMNE
jgi:hypothetical protein